MPFDRDPTLAMTAPPKVKPPSSGGGGGGLVGVLVFFLFGGFVLSQLGGPRQSRYRG